MRATACPAFTPAAGLIRVPMAGMGFDPPLSGAFAAVLRKSTDKG